MCMQNIKNVWFPLVPQLHTYKMDDPYLIKNINNSISKCEQTSMYNVSSPPLNVKAIKPFLIRCTVHVAFE